MTIGDILYIVLLGLVLVWSADMLGIWQRYDRWVAERGHQRRRGRP